MNESINQSINQSYWLGSLTAENISRFACQSLLIDIGNLEEPSGAGWPLRTILDGYFRSYGYVAII
jgi:hypothetical protein